MSEITSPAPPFSVGDPVTWGDSPSPHHGHVAAVLRRLIKVRLSNGHITFVSPSRLTKTTP